jgi:hypothetical protein
MTSRKNSRAAPTVTEKHRKLRRAVAKGKPKHRPAETRVETVATAQKTITKREQLAALLMRDQGATIDQMREATEWLPHTVRAALTGLKKLGYAIDSDKVDGLRTYRAVAPQ